jgi:hypothetical protein
MHMYAEFIHLFCLQSLCNGYVGFMHNTRKKYANITHFHTMFVHFELLMQLFMQLFMQL